MRLLEGLDATGTGSGRRRKREGPARCSHSGRTGASPGARSVRGRECGQRHHQGRGGARAGCCLERMSAARIASPTSGSVTSRIVRSVPPQGQRVASTRKTRCNKSRQRIRFGRRGATGYFVSTASGGCGTAAKRTGDAGASAPQNRTIDHPGGGTRLAIRARKATGSNTNWRTPRRGRFSDRTTRPSSRRLRRDSGTGGRARYRHSRSRSAGRFGAIETPACTDETCVLRMQADAAGA